MKLESDLLVVGQRSDAAGALRWLAGQPIEVGQQALVVDLWGDGDFEPIAGWMDAVVTTPEQALEAIEEYACAELHLVVHGIERLGGRRAAPDADAARLALIARLASAPERLYVATSSTSRALGLGAAGAELVARLARAERIEVPSDEVVSHTGEQMRVLLASPPVVGLDSV